MFKKIYFYYDAEGNFLGEENKITLKAEHCNAKGFYFESISFRTGRFDVPGVAIIRDIGPLKKDPYNEDGRPPTIMLTMAMCHMDFFSGAIEIIGLERPNLCVAGRLIHPYTTGYKKIRTVKYLDEGYEGITSWDRLKRQRLLLT